MSEYQSRSTASLLRTPYPQLYKLDKKLALLRIWVEHIFVPHRCVCAGNKIPRVIQISSASYLIFRTSQIRAEFLFFSRGASPLHTYTHTIRTCRHKSLRSRLRGRIERKLEDPMCAESFIASGIISARLYIYWRIWSVNKWTAVISAIYTKIWKFFH